MRSRRPAEAFTVKSSGGSQQRSTWQSAEIISYCIARERSSAELARQAPRGRRAGSGCGRYGAGDRARAAADRKSTRLNSSHVRISYAVFCLKKKKNSELFH